MGLSTKAEGVRGLQFHWWIKIRVDQNKEGAHLEFSVSTAVQGTS